MDSLKIQDAFAPYYAGRKRFAAPRDRNSRPTEDDARRREAAKRLLRRVLAEPEPEDDSTTEH